MIHSYSSLSTWKTCPRLHQAQYVERRFPYVETPAMARGNRLHTDMENAIEKGTPVPSEWKGNPELVPFLRKFGARAEVKLGMTADGRGCEFFDKSNVYLRGKIDVYLPVVPKRVAILVDWKSGNSRYTDELQAEFYSTLLSSTIIENILFIWGYFSGETPSKTVNVQEAKKKVLELAQRVDNDKLHTPRPGWKCRYCPLKECEFNTSED